VTTENIVRTALANGVRVLAEPVDYVKSVAVGLWLGTGSRYETPDEAGMSHLIEHMLFKGTRTRTAKQIAEEIEHRGGSLNAFTDKESTCYYARVLAEDLPVAVDVLTDMLLNSLYDPEELAREEQVVVEEIRRHEDQPEELVHDVYLQTVWNGHPLSRPVIGTVESVSAIRREHILAYLKRRYAPDRIVISVAGNHDPDSLLGLAESRLGSLGGLADAHEPEPPGIRAERKELPREIEQVHFCLGGMGFSQHEDEKYALGVLDTILGGSMSSRLFQEIREKRGLAYAIGSYALSYAEGGIFAVYGGTSPANYAQVEELILAEMERLCSDPLPDEEIEHAKNQIRGHIVLGLEGMSNRMTRMAKNELYFGRVIPLEETVAKVNAVTPKDVHRVAERCYRSDALAFTAIGPLQNA
jgi:predicted Zn-dependent peptidase